jgi:hypothetical protein
MHHTKSTRLFKVNAAQDRTLVLGFLCEKTTRAEIARDEQQPVEAISSAIGSPDHFCYASRGARAVLSSCSSGSCQPPTLMANDRFMRPPRTGLVWMQGCLFRENGVDDGPGCFYRVFTNEQYGIAMHSIAQQMLIGINPVRCGFLECRKLNGQGDEFFAGALHSGAEAERNLPWTETEAEMIARCAGQTVERRSPRFDKHFGGRNREALSGTNQEWHA